MKRKRPFSLAVIGILLGVLSGRLMQVKVVSGSVYDLAGQPLTEAVARVKTASQATRSDENDSARQPQAGSKFNYSSGGRLSN